MSVGGGRAAAGLPVRVFSGDLTRAGCRTASELLERKPFGVGSVQTRISCSTGPGLETTLDPLMEKCGGLEK